MAKYVVFSKKRKKYEQSYGLPLFNIIPAIVWSIPINQKLFSEARFGVHFLVSVIFIAFYCWLSMKPIIAAIPCLAGAGMLVFLFWVFADAVNNTVVSVILKIVIVLISVLIEFSIFANATIPWLERKNMNNPTIVRIDE